MQAAVILFFVVISEGAPKAPTATPKLLLGRFWPMHSIETVN